VCVSFTARLLCLWRDCSGASHRELEINLVLPTQFSLRFPRDGACLPFCKSRLTWGFVSWTLDELHSLHCHCCRRHNAARTHFSPGSIRFPCTIRDAAAASPHRARLAHPFSLRSVVCLSPPASQPATDLPVRAPPAAERMRELH
jgi:hypothetical protein